MHYFFWPKGSAVELELLLNCEKLWNETEYGIRCFCLFPLLSQFQSYPILVEKIAAVNMFNNIIYGIKCVFSSSFTLVRDIQCPRGILIISGKSCDTTLHNACAYFIPLGPSKSSGWRRSGGTGSAQHRRKWSQRKSVT